MSNDPDGFTAEDHAAAFAAALELQGAPQPLIIEFSPFDAYLLVGLLQLNLKCCPDLPLNTRAYAIGLVETLRMFFQAMDCAEVVRHIDMGPRS